MLRVYVLSAVAALALAGCGSTPLLAKATGQAFAAGFTACAPTAATQRR